MSDAFRNSMSRTVTMYNQMTKTIAKYTNDIQKTINTVNKLNIEVGGIDEAISSFKVYGTEGDKSLSQVGGTLAAMSGVFSDTVSKMREIQEISGIADNISVVSDTLNKAAGAVQTTGNMIDILTNSSSSATEKMDAMAGTVYAIGDTIDSVSSSNSAVAETFSSVGGTIASASDSTAAVIDTMGAVTNTISTVKDTISNIEESIGTAANAIGTAGDMITTITDSSTSAADKMNTVKETIGAVSETIGAVSQSVKSAIDTIDSVTSTIDSVKNTVGTVTDTFKTTKETMNTIKGTVDNMRQAKEKFTLVTKLQAIAQKALNMVLNANPMGIIITVIGLLIAAGTALYQNWDVIKEKAQLLWDNIMVIWDMLKQYTLEIWASFKETITGAVEGAKEIVIGFGSTILEIWENIQSTTLEIWENIKTTVFGVFTNIVEAVIGFKDKIVEIWENIKEFLKNPIKGTVDLIQKMTGNNEEETMKKGTKNAWGIARVPRDNYNAILHEGERVLTKREVNQSDNLKAAKGNNINININGYNKSTDEILNDLMPRLKLALVNI